MQADAAQQMAQPLHFCGYLLLHALIRKGRRRLHHRRHCPKGLLLSSLFRKDPHPHLHRQIKSFWPSSSFSRQFLPLGLLRVLVPANYLLLPLHLHQARLAALGWDLSVLGSHLFSVLLPEARPVVLGLHLFELSSLLFSVLLQGAQLEVLGLDLFVMDLNLCLLLLPGRQLVVLGLGLFELGPLVCLLLLPEAQIGVPGSHLFWMLQAED